MNRDTAMNREAKRMNHIGIDVFTRSKSKLLARLRTLPTTIAVHDGGEYREDRNYSQIHLTTTESESEVEDWLYRTNQDYVGTFAREEA